jgi:endonuclease/exonuclease/phosphatase (EEP) superfamily protein YafD
LKVISWNLLRLTGAAVEDVAALIERERPDLLLMQEATGEIETLPSLVGGHFHWEPLPARIHGLAAWSPHPLPPPQSLPLPISRMPGRVPRRMAQLIRIGDVTVANVHLSHGQLLNRRQLLRIARTLDGPAAVIGDYNAVGPTALPGFRDVGPREPTHIASNVLPFRLDRCLVRGLHCADARALDRGPSDHRPIALELAAQPAAMIGQIEMQAPAARARRVVAYGRATRRV